VATITRTYELFFVHNRRSVGRTFHFPSFLWTLAANSFCGWPLLSLLRPSPSSSRPNAPLSRRTRDNQTGRGMGRWPKVALATWSRALARGRDKTSSVTTPRLRFPVRVNRGFQAENASPTTLSRTAGVLPPSGTVTTPVTTHRRQGRTGMIFAACTAPAYQPPRNRSRQISSVNYCSFTGARVNICIICTRNFVGSACPRRWSRRDENVSCTIIEMSDYYCERHSNPFISAHASSPLPPLNTKRNRNYTIKIRFRLLHYLCTRQWRSYVPRYMFTCIWTIDTSYSVSAVGKHRRTGSKFNRLSRGIPKTTEIITVPTEIWNKKENSFRKIFNILLHNHKRCTNKYTI